MSSKQTSSPDKQSSTNNETTIEVITESSAENRRITVDNTMSKSNSAESSIIPISGKVVEINTNNDENSIISVMKKPDGSIGKTLSLFVCVKVNGEFCDVQIGTDIIEDILEITKSEAIRKEKDRKLKGEMITNKECPLVKQAKEKLLESEIKVEANKEAYPHLPWPCYAAESIEIC